MAIFDDDAEMDRLAKYFSRLKVVDDVPNINALIQSFSSLSITDHLVVPLTNTIPTTPVNSPQPIHIHPLQSSTPSNTQEDPHPSQVTDCDKHEVKDDCHTDSDYDNDDNYGDDDKTIELNRTNSSKISRSIHSHPNCCSLSFNYSSLATISKTISTMNLSWKEVDIRKVTHCSMN